MAIIKKDFFRHSIHLGEDPRIVEIVRQSKENYFYYLRLVELCAREALKHPVTPRSFKFHRDSICFHLRINNSNIEFRLRTLEKQELIKFELDERFFYIKIFDLPYFLGNYEKKDEKENGATTPKRTQEQKDRAKRIKNTYISAYYKRYGIEPTFVKKEHSLAYTLMERVGFEEGLALAKSYPLFNDPWHVGKKHPFAMLISDLDKVRVELRDPKRMLDKRRMEKQINEAEENIELTEEKQRIQQAIKEERAQQIEQ